MTCSLRATWIKRNFTVPAFSIYMGLPYFGCFSRIGSACFIYSKFVFCKLWLRRTLILHHEFEALVSTNTDINKLASLLRGCDNPRALLEGKQVHDHICRLGLGKDRYLGNLLVQMYGKCGALQEAREVFNKMANRNSFSWNIMIAAYAQYGQLADALNLFHEMPDKTAVSWTAMITAYVQQGNLEMAYVLFQQMPYRDIVSWNAMIAAYTQHGCLNTALHLFRQMPQRNVISWTTMITAYANQGLLAEALQLFHMMPHKNVVSWTAMIGACAQHGEIDKARRLFHQMPERDVVTWNTIISCYVQMGRHKEALDMFHQMQEENMKPNRVTFITVLDACANHADLTTGKQIHNFILQCGIELNDCVGNALVNMYGKCGNVGEAHALFDKMISKDAITWSSVIAAYAQCGHSKEALEVFQDMKLNGIMPSRVTFVSVLSACDHAGYLDGGCHHLLSISHNSISVTLEHFNCIIDLLGRIGHLNETEALVNNLPLEPDAGSWRGLLSCCRNYSDIGGGTRAAQHIMKLDPEKSGGYVLLSNMLSAIHKIVSE